MSRHGDVQGGLKTTSGAGMKSFGVMTRIMFALCKRISAKGSAHARYLASFREGNSVKVQQGIAGMATFCGLSSSMSFKSEDRSVEA